MSPYHGNLVGITCENDDFRRVLSTSARTQTVLMAIPPGEDIGAETHEHTEQLLFCVQGQGTAVLDGARSSFVPGALVVVPPGVRHNILNAGSDKLHLFTVYSPPNHLPGRVHATKAEAEADVEDAAVEQGRAGASGHGPAKFARGSVKVRRIGTVADRAVWLVAGRKVRDTLDVDFTTGGNPARYGYVPEGELWIEASMSPADVAATIVHEAVELDIMRTRGLAYGAAHVKANTWEKKARARLQRAAPRTREAAADWAGTFLERVA